MPETTPAITPDTRLAELLERWPLLEGVLVDLSPHFRALQNPVLRRTVAKVATLRQVARVGGVGLGALIARLRAATGQPPCEEAGAPAGEERAPGAAPPWARAPHVTRRRDARDVIERGGHPMAEVLEDLGALAAGEVYELVTPFVPAPLVDLARARGLAVHGVVESDEVVRTYFRRGGRDEPPAE